MSAVVTRMVRSGRSFVITAADQLVLDNGPDIYGHVHRRRLGRVEWEITAGPSGEPLAFGTTWTRNGAWIEAIAAAHRPGLGRSKSRGVS